MNADVDKEDASGSVQPGNWRADTAGDKEAGHSLGKTGSNNFTKAAATLRDKLAEYLSSSDGEVRKGAKPTDDDDSTDEN